MKELDDDEFRIGLRPETLSTEDGSYAYADLKLGEFEESVLVPLNFWSRRQYLEQWVVALRELLSPTAKSALIVEMIDPICRSHFWTWQMWREENVVYLQNRLLFFQNPPEHDFDPVRVADFVGLRSEVTEDGQAISQWFVPVAAIHKYLRNLDCPDASGSLEP